ncbi:MAG: FAD:protein FMN transferase [Thiotrichales bacterium]|nr:FAD:protein FMN transferase [Thiotrichales bacterium]
MQYRRTSALLALLFICILVTACSKTQDEPIYRNQIFAFGTIVELTLFNTNDETGDRLSSEIRLMMEEFHHHWHAWQNGPLTELNNALSDTKNKAKQYSVSTEDAKLINQALTLAKASDALFNPTLGKLIALWGFHKDEPNTAPPSAQQIADTLNSLPSLEDISIGNNTISNNGDKPIHFDFGGFAKGVIIDRTIRFLRQSGVENAIVNAGGDLRAIGSAGNRPWRIGIRHPRDLGVFASLTIDNDEAVFTSGDYERYFEHNGQRYHHIIDPRSGYPANTIASVTVVHNDGATADAAATALFIAGKQHWPRIAKSMGIEHVMIIDKENKVEITAKLAQRMEYEVTPPPNIEIRHLP